MQRLSRTTGMTMMSAINSGYRLIKQTVREYSKDNVPRLGAAMAYYTIFSLAPLLIIAIGIAGLAFGQDAARGQIMEQLRDFIGATGAQAIEAMVENASQPSAGIIATIIGI